MSKKTLLFILLVLVAIIIFIIGIYLLFIKKPIPDTKPVSQFPVVDTATTTTPVIQDTETQTATTTVEVILPTLNRLSIAPTAGAMVYQTRISTSTSSTTPIVRYTDRATAHTYQVSAEGLNRERISATTINQIQESLWSGEWLLLRKINSSSDTEQTINAKLATSTDGQGRLVSSIIPTTILNITQSPTKNKYAFIKPTETGAGSLVITSSMFTNAKELLSLPINEWQLQWPQENTITITTKPSSSVLGYMYSINTSNGLFTKMLGGISGLTTNANSNLSYVLYTDSKSGYPNTQVFNTKTKTAEFINIDTLSEKCIWSKKETNIVYCAVPNNIPSGSYPDDWYKGKILFDDSIVKIDVKNQLITNLYDISESEDIDAVTLFLSEKEDYLFFTNKHDYFLWSLRLTDF